MARRKNRDLGRFFDEEIPEHEAIHLAAGKRAVGIRRRGHDWLAAQIERSVEDNRHARGLPEALDQSVIKRALLAVDRLHARGTVYVRDRR